MAERVVLSAEDVARASLIGRYRSAFRRGAVSAGLRGAAGSAVRPHGRRGGFQPSPPGAADHRGGCGHRFGVALDAVRLWAYRGQVPRSDSISVRLSALLLERVRAASALENRSMSNYIESVLASHFESGARNMQLDLAGWPTPPMTESRSKA